MLRVYPPPYFWILHIDGSAMPNPGRMSIGAVLTGPDGAAFTLDRALHGAGCNNEAELRALQAGLQLAAAQGAQTLRIYTDSQWLVEQLAQPLASLKPVRPTVRLAPLLDAARCQLQALVEVQWRWIPRRCNAQADALARQASLQTNEY